jgi:hypothetical protein
MTPIDGPQDRFARLEAVKGETYAGQVEIYAADGATPIDLTGYAVKFYLWEGTTPVVDGQVCTVTPASGRINIDLTAAQTLAMNPVSYHFELWARNTGGQNKLLLWGWFSVSGSCSQA